MGGGLTKNDREAASIELGQRDAAAYYVWPLVWLGTPPENMYAVTETGAGVADIDPAQLAEVVADADLPQGLRVRAYRDGMFLFDFSEWAPMPSVDPSGSPAPFEELSKMVLRRVGLLNAHLLCFHDAVAEHQELGLGLNALSPSLILPTSFEAPEGVSLPDQRIAHIHSARYESTYAPGLLYRADSRVSMRIPVGSPAVDGSFSRLSEILSSPDSERIITLLDLLARSGSAYSAHDFNVCLVIAWTVSESLLQELWDHYLRENREDVDGTVVINGDRRSFLAGAEVTARITSEFLSLLGELPFDLYQDLNSARQARNKWVHELRPVSYTVAAEAMTTAERMLKLVHDIEIVLPKSLSLHT
jgi:hypothetical protein